MCSSGDPEVGPWVASDGKEAGVSRMSAAFGLLALAIVLAIVGLAITAVKWLLIIAAVLFLLGVLRAAVSSRGGTPGGPDAR